MLIIPSRLTIQEFLNITKINPMSSFVEWQNCNWSGWNIENVGNNSVMINSGSLPKISFLVKLNII